MTLINGMLCFTPARSDDGKIDIEGCVLAARKAAEEFAAQDDVLTVQIGQAAIKVWEDPKFSGLKLCSPSALGRMAINALGMIPNDKVCKEAAKKVKSVLSGQPDKFLFVKKGPKKGFHYKARYTEGELALLNNQK